MPIFLRKRSIVALIIALGLLLLVIAATFFLIARQRQDQAAVQHSLDVELRLWRVFSTLQDAETGQRGYLLMHNEDYLTPYNAATRDIDGEIAALQLLVADNDRQSRALAHLRELARKKLDELLETVDLAREGKQDAAIEQVQTNKGRAIMGRIRALVQLMNQTEQQLLS